MVLYGATDSGKPEVSQRTLFGSVHTQIDPSMIASDNTDRMSAAIVPVFLFILDFVKFPCLNVGVSSFCRSKGLVT